MKYHVAIEEAPFSEGPGYKAFRLLDERNGCVSGCKTGISLYVSETYGPPGVHDDQEGFVVLSGSGWAKIGGEEFRLKPETSFIAPAKTPHSIRKDSGTDGVKVFWFHAAV